MPTLQLDYRDALLITLYLIDIRIKITKYDEEDNYIIKKLKNLMFNWSKNTEFAFFPSYTYQLQELSTKDWNLLDNSNMPKLTIVKVTKWLHSRRTSNE